MRRIKQDQEPAQSETATETATTEATGDPQELKTSQLKKIRGGYMGSYQGCDFPNTQNASWGGGYGGGWGGGYGGGWGGGYGGGGYGGGGWY